MGLHKRMNGTFTPSRTSFAETLRLIRKLPHFSSSALDVAHILFAMSICTKDRSEVMGGLA